MKKFTLRFSLLWSVVLITFLAPSPGCYSPPEKEPDVSKRLLFTFEGNAGVVTDVTYSPDGKMIASVHKEPWGSADSEDPHVPPLGESERLKVLREVKIWDADTGDVHLSIKTVNYTYAVRFFPDCQHLAGAVGNVVKVWDTTTGKETIVLKGHTALVFGLVISRDGKRLVTSSNDGTLKVWDSVSGNCLQTLQGHGHERFFPSTSPDGKRVVSRGDEKDFNKEIRIWDLATENEALSWTPSTPISWMVFSPTDERIASLDMKGGKDLRAGLIEVWDASTGKLCFSCKPHSGPITSIAYSLDGKRLASGSQDGTVVVSNANTGEEMLRFVAYWRPGNYFRAISSIAFRSDGNRLATVGPEGPVMIWNLDDLNNN